MFYSTDLKDLILILILAVYVESLPHKGTLKLLDAEKLMSSLQMANIWSQNMSNQKQQIKPLCTKLVLNIMYITEFLAKFTVLIKYIFLLYIFFIVVPCILITSRFLSPTNALFY